MHLIIIFFILLQIYKKNIKHRNIYNKIVFKDMAEVTNLNWTVSKNKNWIHVKNRATGNEINSGSGNMNIIITTDEARTSTETDLYGTVTFTCSEVSKSQTISVTRCKPVGCSCDYLTLSPSQIQVPAQGYETATTLVTVNWPSCIDSSSIGTEVLNGNYWVQDLSLNAFRNPIAKISPNTSESPRSAQIKVYGTLQGTTTTCEKMFTINQEGKSATCGCDYIEKIYNPSIFTPIPYNEASSHNVYTFDGACADSYNFVVEGDLMNYGKDDNGFYISYKPNQTGEPNDITVTPYFNAQPCTGKILNVTQAANPNPPIECNCNSLQVDKENISIQAGSTGQVTITAGSCINITSVRSSDANIATSSRSGNIISIVGVAAGSATVTISYKSDTGEQYCQPKYINVTVTNSTECGCGDIELSNDNVTIEEINN